MSFLKNFEKFGKIRKKFGKILKEFGKARKIKNWMRGTLGHAATVLALVAHSRAMHSEPMFTVRNFPYKICAESGRAFLLKIQ